MPEYNAGSASISMRPSFRDFVKDAESKLKAMDLTAQVRLKPQTDEADAELGRWRAQQEADPVKIRAVTDSSSASTAKKDFSKFTKDLKDAGAINLKVLAVDGAAGAVTSLLSIADAAAKVSHAFALIPALGFAGIAGAGAVATGISGLPGVFKDLQAASKDSASAASKQQDALDGVAEAEYRVGEAQQSVQTANREATLSVQALNDAYKDEARSLRDANNQLAEQKIATEEASLSVKDAALRLQEVQHNPVSSATERQRAQLDYESAVLRLRDQQNKTQDLAADTAKANAKGIEGSKAIVDAKQRVADAAQNEVKAQHEVTQAYEGLRKAQDEIKNGVGSQSQLNVALAGLSGNARELVDDIRSLGPAWSSARKESQDALTYGIGPAVKDLADKQLPNLREGLVGIDRAFNTGLRATLLALSSKTNIADFKTSLTNTAAGFQNLARGAAPLTDALTKLVTVGTSFLPGLGDGIAGVETKFNDLIQRTAADGSLRKWIQDGLTSARELGQTFEHVGSAIASVFRAAAAGGTGLKGLDDATAKIAAFLKSGKGQDELTKFFAAARAEGEKWKPILADLPSLLKGVFDGVRVWAAITMPFLTAAASLLRDHATLVSTVVVAYLAFKTISPIIDGVRLAIDNAGSMLTKFRDTASKVAAGTVSAFRAVVTGASEVATAQGKVAQVADIGAVSLGRFGSAIQQLGTSIPIVGRMQQAFLDTATSASAFGRTQGVIAAAATGIKASASSVLSFFGGPWVVGIAAAGAVLTANISSSESAKRAQQTLAEAVVAGTKAQQAFETAVATSNGALNTQAISAGADAVKAALSDITTLGDRGHSSIDNLGHVIDNLTGSVFGLNSGWEHNYDTVSSAVDKNDALKSVMKDMKIDLDDVGRLTVQGGEKYEQLITALRQTGDAGTAVATTLQDQRTALQQVQDAARNTTPGFQTLTAAVKTLADESASASDRLDAMKTALDTLAGKPVQISDALAQYNQVARNSVTVTQELADHSQGWGAALIGTNGAVNTQTANGAKLYDTLKQIRDATAEVALSGADMGPILDRNQQQFKHLATATGLSVNQINAMATAAGYVPQTITMLAQLKGADTVEQQLVVIDGLLKANANGVDIRIGILSDAAKQKLTDAGAQLDVLKDKGVIHVTAPNQAALDAIQAIIDQLNQIKDKKVDVQVTGKWDTSPQYLPWLKSPASPTVEPWQQAAPTPHATGGPITGGIPGKDSVAILAKPGEHMFTTDDVERLGGQSGVYRFRAALQRGQVGKYAVGGAVDASTSANREQALISFAESRNGQPYGGNEDCTGFQSELANIAVGLPPGSGRMATSNEGDWLTAMGFQLGSGPGGSYRIGWINDPNMAAGGHSAGTLPNETNVESGGSTSKVMYGGAAIGSANNLFNQHAYLTMGQGIGIGVSGGASNSKVDSRSVLYPQAPLPGRQSDAQLSVLTDRAAVDDANSIRNQVYADPASSAQDKLSADAKYEQAQNTLETAMKNTDRSAISLQGFATKAAGILANGILGVFGLENSVFSDTNVYNKALNDTVTGLNEHGIGSPLGGYSYKPQNMPEIVTTVTPQAAAVGAVPVAPGATDGSIQGVVKSAVADKGWNTGPEWDSLNQLVSHESSWNPTAQNPGSTAFGAFQFLDSTWATVGATKTSDPYAQAKAGEKYIAQRYGDPIGAWSFWQKQNPHWYDEGGVASGVGFLAKNIIAPERKLSPHQTETYDSMLPLLESINTTAWANPSAIASTPFAATGQSSAGNGDDYSTHTHINQPRVASVEDLVDVAERNNQRRAIGMMAALPA